MLTFTPTLIEDELIYSYLGRCYLLSGYSKRETFMRASVGQDLRLLTPAAYGAFDIKTPFGCVVDRNEVLMRHTLFPFHRLHLPDQVRDQIVLSCWDGTPRTYTKWIDYSELTPKCLRFCCECAKLQIRQFGCAVWTRAHNLPHVTACSVHGVKLQYATNVPLRNYPEPFVFPDVSDAIAVPADAQEIQYARKAAQLMNVGMSAHANPRMLRKFHRQCLSDLVGGTVHTFDDEWNLMKELLRRIRMMGLPSLETLSDGQIEQQVINILYYQKRTKHEAVFGVLMLLLFSDDLDVRRLIESLVELTPDLEVKQEPPPLIQVEEEDPQLQFDFA
jgi:hypothetical protein